jgi:hypothetical protein
MKPLRPDKRTVGHCSGDAAQKRFQTNFRYPITNKVWCSGDWAAWSQSDIIATYWWQVWLVHLEPTEWINKGQSHPSILRDRVICKQDVLEELISTNQEMIRILRKPKCQTYPDEPEFDPSPPIQCLV